MYIALDMAHILRWVYSGGGSCWHTVSCITLEITQSTLISKKGLGDGKKKKNLMWTPQLITYLSGDVGWSSQGLLRSTTKNNNIQATPQQPKSLGTSSTTPPTSHNTFPGALYHSSVFCGSLFPQSSGWHRNKNIHEFSGHIDNGINDMFPISLEWMHASSSQLLGIIAHCHLWVISAALSVC